MPPRIAVLPGDGIGPEVTAAAVRVAEAAGLDAEWVHGDVGWDHWCREGEALPEQTHAILDATDACLFGAITSKPPAEAEAALDGPLQELGLRYQSPILQIRMRKGLHTNVRPTTFWPGVPGPLRTPPPGRDGKVGTITVFRENTEGLYARCEAWPLASAPRQALRDAFPGFGRFDGVHDEDIAVTVRVVSRGATRRLMHAAFEHAVAEGHPTVTLAEKPNVLRATGGLVLETAQAVAAEYPGVTLVSMNLDALATDLVLHPERHPVVAATNLFGDVLSDLAAGLAGGLGLAPSANLGNTYGLFEPVHGSAPDIAGQNIADPIGAVLSVALLADHLGHGDVRRRIETTVGHLLADGSCLTPDLGGTATTTAVTDRLVTLLAEADPHPQGPIDL